MTSYRGLGQIKTDGVGVVDVLHRLALAVQPVDGVTRRRISGISGVRVGREGVRPLARSDRTINSLIAFSPTGADDGGQYVLRHGITVGTSVRIRLDDPQRRWMPRRLDVPLWTLAQVEACDLNPNPNPPAVYLPPDHRLIRPSLMPGPAYRYQPGTTGVRLRVRRGGANVPWPRAEVFDDVGRVGWAHGDDRGELLILVPIPVDSALPADVALAVRLHYPDPKWVDVPTRAAPDPSDPLRDLHPEPVPQAPQPPAPVDLDDDVARGLTLPPGYLTAATDRVVTFTRGRVVTRPDLTID